MRELPVLAIVLNYNGREVTLQTLQSLQELTYGNLEILVVDNGSSDGSLEAINERFPDVVQVRTEQNLGAAGGLNLGLQRGLIGRYEYFLVLNNDIEVAPSLLSEMVKVAESDETIGCVGPKSYYYGDRNRLWSAGGRICFREAVTKERGMGKIDHGQYDRDEEVDYVNGCAMLVRRNVLVEVGLFDPLFHLSVEDADWCMRMKELGYRSYYAHRARLWHMVSHTTGSYKPGRTFQTGRSTALFVRRYASPLQWTSFLLFLLAAIPAAFLREAMKGNQAAVLSKLRGFWIGMRTPMTPPPSLRIDGAT